MLRKYFWRRVIERVRSGRDLENIAITNLLGFHGRFAFRSDHDRLALQVIWDFRQNSDVILHSMMAKIHCHSHTVRTVAHHRSKIVSHFWLGRVRRVKSRNSRCRTDCLLKSFRLSDKNLDHQQLELPTKSLSSHHSCDCSYTVDKSMSSTNSTSKLNHQSDPTDYQAGETSQFSNKLQRYHSSNPLNEHHFKFSKHEILAGRYEILGVLGRGTFAQVLLCRHLSDDHLETSEDIRPRQNQCSQPSKQLRNVIQVAVHVAVKVICNIERYRLAAQREIQVLQRLTQHRMTCVPDSQHARGAEGCIQFLGSFVIQTRHPCMVFPVLSLSLHDFLCSRQFRPFIAAHVRHIAFQLLSTCQYLHNECGIIHTDIKSDNVLFVDSASASVRIGNVDVDIPYNTAVRVIDFGNAVFINQHEKPAIATSRPYRSIEVVLGIGWSTGVDLWAIGCLLMEIYTGHRLFDIGQGTDTDHLNAMNAVLGPIPIHVKNKSRIFPPQQGQSSISMNSPLPAVFQLNPLQKQIASGDWYFYDLVSRLLAYDTTKRLTAQQALYHPYFTQPLG